MGSLRTRVKALYEKISPAYRTARRIEVRIEELHQQLERRLDKLDQLFWYARMEEGKPLSQTKREFFAAMPPAEGLLRTIQLGNNCLLRRFKALCQENNIQWWISFGTLLGAARHKGFVPWDDDVDVSLLRADFEKLKAALEGHETLELRRYYDEHGNYYLYKLALRGRDNPPLWLDITIWDYADTKPLGFEETWSRIAQVRAKNDSDFRRLAGGFDRCYHSEQLSDAHADALQEAADANRALLPPVETPDSIFRSLDSVYLGGETLMMLEEIFPLCRLSFEGEEYPAPCGYLDYLTNVYHYLDFPAALTPEHMRLNAALVRYVDEYVREVGLEDELRNMER